MKKKSIVPFLATILLGSTCLNTLVSVSADHDFDARIKDQERTIIGLRREEEQAQRKIDEATDRVNQTNKREDELRQSVMKQRILAKSLAVDIAQKRLSAVKRQKVIEKVVREVQLDGGVSGKLALFFKVVAGSKNLKDGFSLGRALALVHKAQRENLQQQQKDLRTIEVKEADAIRCLQQLEADRQALDQTRLEQIKAKANLEKAILELRIQREGEESKKGALIAEKARIEAEEKVKAEAEMALQKEEGRRRAILQEQARQAEAEQVAKNASLLPQKPNLATTTSSSSENNARSVAPFSSLFSRKEEASEAQAPNVSPITPELVAPTPAPPISVPSNAGGGFRSANVGNMQCTTFVTSQTGFSVPGNAGSWAYNAAMMGYPVGSTPHVGDVFCCAPGVAGAGGVGHVGIVTGVDGNMITTSEGNFNGAIGSRTVSGAGMQFITPKK